MIRVSRFIKDLSAKQWLETIELPEWHMRKGRYILPGQYEYETETAAVQSVNPLHSKHGTTYFLSNTVDIPSSWHADPVGLIFEAGGEGLLKVNGVAYHGLDRNHQFVPLALDRVGSSPLLEIELYDPIPEPHDPLNKQAVIQPPIGGIRAALARVNEPLQSLLYTVTVISEAVRLLPEQDLRRLRLSEALHRAMDTMYDQPDSRWTDAEWIASLEQSIVSKVKENTNEQPDGIMHMVGQSHIDVAWLWPVRETVRKVSRTFSTVCALMDEYPDFRYSQSQPLLYAFAKEHYPQLYEKMKARIAEGRWELVGGMWVEPDLNIPSGESLVRQILYGQRFYKQEFGKTSSIEWLPDTFGYCASLPQLLKQAGVEYFMTTKLNWNDTNPFPYDLFEWVGIDGTSITSYLNHGVNEHTRPKDVHEHWESFRQKDRHDEQMLLYGHGDGGGGVTREMVEFVLRSAALPGLPASRFGTAADFFGEIGRRAPALPKWHGDLYLELHRGTYTTHARNKRSNRKAEVLYREAEIWDRMAFPAETSGANNGLHEGWKLILLNQFHDIIPGTSIPEVYETSSKEYTEVFALGEASLTASLRALTESVDTAGEGKPYVIFNSLGWERNETVCIEKNAELLGLAAYDSQGNRLEADVLRSGDDPGRYSMSVAVPAIPAFGYKTIWLRPAPDTASPNAPGASDEAFPSVWESQYYTLEFNGNGEIVRWYDKTERRDWILPGGKANEFQFFHDKPTYWDAWDIDPRFEEQRAGEARLLSKEVIQQGSARDVLRFRWSVNESEISQDIIFYKHNRRVDFKTKVRWSESHKLLKVAFPVDIVANKATYEIPFGALERPTHRNTSWERAQFEVCGHRWADVSEGGGGVSLLNDCKYGYDIKEGAIRLSLLRAPKWPDRSADLGEHEFTYSLYPHAQDWRSAQVVRRAMELNHPALAVAAEPHSGKLPAEYSWIGLQSDHVVLDSVKRSEDGSATILRFYESSGGRQTVTVQWPETNVKAFAANLLEEQAGEIDVRNGSFELSFKPFEIKTVKLVK
ncbi:alpha-mannosidase [Paenibacillus alkalitolerans]|uniref:alpha-mannosidase n=1 Tax=Paenibacillus alkalitolerans TaxID=2799335 RepID=UPI0018F6DD8C|nr:alpha-mannosidase [Paenibacillus alkalitolerans]